MWIGESNTFFAQIQEMNFRIIAAAVQGFLFQMAICHTSPCWLLSLSCQLLSADPSTGKVRDIATEQTYFVSIVHESNG